MKKVSTPKKVYDYYLMIANKENKVIFSIAIDGTVRWLKDGKLVKAKTDNALAAAFAAVIVAKALSPKP